MADDDTLVPANAGEVWTRLKQSVASFVDQWLEGEPPPIEPHVPREPEALRRLTLVELVKVDLEKRSRRREWHKPLDAYLREFPELAEAEGPPCDLIYEEYRVRRQVGEQVTREEYLARFPGRAGELRRLLFTAGPDATTQLFASAASIDEIDVDQRVDDFDLLAKLGKGAFASVFLARQRSLGRMVALKVSSDRGHEPQTLAQMDHPNIVRVYDQRLLAERDLRLLYMQYVPGGTLEDVVNYIRTTPVTWRHGGMLLEVIDRNLTDRGESIPTDSRTRQEIAKFSWPQAICWLGARLATALAYAHGQGILHRDLKPANVLLAADGNPKLADFNISFSSKIAGSTPAAYFGGSLAYMSPEQLEACNPAHDRNPDSLDGRSDVFSLGVLLWELLTGQRPFNDDAMVSYSPQSLFGMVDRRRSGPDKVQVAQLADCPTGLIEVLQKCLAVDPDARYASAAEVARQLDLCLQPQVERMLRPPASSWLWLARRHPLVAVIIAGVIPNAIESGLNIAYNIEEIVRQLHSDEVMRVFNEEMMAINSVAYTLGIAIIMKIAWPVLRAVKQHTVAPKPPGDEERPSRCRTLMLGDCVAWTSAIEWIISGVVFPVWMHVELGDASGMKTHHYVHFLASQFLCGTMAATLSFFCVTLVAVRAFCPALVDVRGEDPDLARSLDRLSRWVPYYAYVACAVFPLAMIIMPIVHTESRFAFLVLGIVGLAASAFALLLAREIQRDVAALKTAIGAGDK